MKISPITFYIAINFILIIESRVLIVPDQKLEDCTDESERANMFDFSEFELIPVNDTHTFINGKWKFLQDLNSPWKGSLTTEKYIQGEWLMQAFSRNYNDICEVLHSPTEPFYDFSKNLAECPVKAGTIWEFDMAPIVFSEVMLNAIPSHYVGRWRAIFIGEFETSDGKTLKDCKRGYADIYEE